ncbi:MAG: hypothetical protein HY821_02040 [Acidobacteria bacterium]|nr:hypothetical protein [Acidobacteriota bacterium]
MKKIQLAFAFLLLLPVAADLMSSGLFTASAGKKSDKIKPAPPEPPVIKSLPLPVLPSKPGTAPSTPILGPSAPAPMAPIFASSPRAMKLLVLTATGNEPSFQAITFFLGYLGIPYQSVILSQNPLPQLYSGSRGEYQGIVLATGNPAVCDPNCRALLTAADWTALDNYARDYGVRTVAWYAWPEARYGLASATGGGVSTDTVTASMAFTSSAASVFPYLNRSNPLKVKQAYYYPAIASAASGETTVPLLTINGSTVGALHTKADGREYLAFTFDNNPYLTHSLAVQYGVFNWVTKGVFLGARKAYFIPQNDDYFLENDLFEFGVPACMPSDFTNEPTSDASSVCATDRMDTGDLKAIVSWQDKWKATTQYRNFKVTMAFNGWGASAKYGGQGPDKDPLTTETLAQKSKFFWMNHTYDHENLDCYNPVPNSGNCVQADYKQSVAEISQNVAVSKAMALPLDATSMVTPGISGLYNPFFLSAAASQGLRYLAGDTSRSDGNPAVPNTGIRSPFQSSILIVPRRATSIYYNTKSGRTAVDGSLPDEYNYFYGPSGIFNLNGSPWFTTTQTWAQILDRESDALVSYMLRGEMYPVMFHQSNFIRYDGSRTLFTEVVDMAFSKFTAISNLPVVSLAHSDVGRAMEMRMGAIAANVSGTLYPGQQIVLTGTGAATVQVTGICKTGCESYGGQSISKIPLTLGSATVLLP